MNRALLLLAAWAAMAGSALGASRGRYGGVLRLAVVGHPPASDPSLADAPAEAAVLALTSSALCRLNARQQPRTLLASQITWEEPLRLRIDLRKELDASGGTALSAGDVLASWSRLGDPGALSPYRALLFALRDDALRRSSAPQPLDLPLAFPWPDLLSSLCHPALAIRSAAAPHRTVGPFFTSAPLELEARVTFPLGRPFLDKLLLAFADERAAARRLSLRQVQLTLGGIGSKGPTTDGAALFATYLAFRPERAGTEFRQSFEAAIDRAELTRFFVRAPAQPMHALLPPALMPDSAPLRPPPLTPATSSARSLSLLYDQSLPEQRLVAQRLQVKLHDAKYAVALKAMPRAALRSAWASGQFELMLCSVLLPPAAGPALALALEIAGHHELLASELPPIGALSSETERQQAAVERARALLPSVSLIPLYAQGLRASSSERLASFAFDGQGLPLLDDAFLLPE